MSQGWQYRRPKSVKARATGKRYSRAEARKIFAAAAKLEHKMSLTRHFIERMDERKVTMQDVVQLGKNGNVLGEPEQHVKTGSWTYRIEGEDLDGFKLAVVFEVLNEAFVRLITVIDGGEEVGRCQ